MSLIICTAISRYFVIAPAFFRKNPPFSSAIDDTMFAASDRVPVKNDSFPAIRYAATASLPIARHISTIGPTSCRAKSQITLGVTRTALLPPRTIHQVLQQRLQRIFVLRVQHQLHRIDHRGESADERGNHVLDLHFGHDLHRRLLVSTDQQGHTRAAATWKARFELCSEPLRMETISVMCSATSFA